MNSLQDQIAKVIAELQLQRSPPDSKIHLLSTQLWLIRLSFYIMIFHIVTHVSSIQVHDILIWKTRRLSFRFLISWNPFKANKYANSYHN